VSLPKARSARSLRGEALALHEFPHGAGVALKRAEAAEPRDRSGVQWGDVLGPDADPASGRFDFEFVAVFARDPGGFLFVEHEGAGSQGHPSIVASGAVRLNPPDLDPRIERLT
jgi:hypothetical protein